MRLAYEAALRDGKRIRVKGEKKNENLAPVRSPRFTLSSKVKAITAVARKEP